MKKKLLFLAGLFFITSRIYSQTIDAIPETQTICSGASATLSAVVTPGAGTPPTNSYTISTIPYTPDAYGAGTVVPGMGDDTQSGILPIGFNFCFFGTTYSNFYVGSNGWVAFSLQPTTFTSASIPSTGGAIPKNCIMGPWQDWYPGLSANCVRYQLLGTAPFRRLVVSWNNCPMFSCTSTLGTFQITIYETTNFIENYIQVKPACLGWAGGTAVQGLHNAAGTIAFTVPGRNSTQWTAANEGWRYTPNGTSLYQINWYILPANTLIGTGSPISVTPPTSPQYYYAEVVDLNACSAVGSGNNTDTVVVLTNVVPVDAGAYTPICAGSSANLNATSAAAISYSWSPAGSLSNPNIANPIATPGATTTYTVSVMDATGCVGTDTVTIAFANPLVTSGATPAAICIGASATLNAAGGSNFSWSPAATLSNPAISNPVATPSVTTTYTVTVSDASLGCTSTSAVTLTVNPLPVVDAGVSTAICTGTTTTLNASGATNFVWSPAGSLSSSTVSNPTSSATATTTYTVVGTDGNGCSSSDTVTVTVNPLPVVDAGANTTICPSSAITLNGSGATTYLWSPAATLSNPAISNPVASPSSATTYTVVGTDVNGCSSSDAVTISINPINVFTTGTATICAGASTSLGAFGASNYSWSPAGTLSNASVSSPVATPLTTTTYTVVGTNAAGCNDTAFVTITVNPSPLVDAGVSTAICSGATTTLNATGAVNYSWSPAGSLSSSTVSNPTSSATSTTTYTVIGTDANGCSATDNITVTVNPLPTVDAGSNVNICPGSSTTLNGSGATNYAWSPAGSLDNPAVSNPVATPSSSTTYTVTGTDINGCSATDVVTVNVSGIIVTANSASSAICAGSNTVLSAGGGTAYLWSPSATLSNDTATNPIATPVSTTTYTVIGTAGPGAGCNDTAFVTVTVNPLPIVDAGSAISICSGTTTTLNASGAVAYVWSPAGSLSSAVVSNPTSSATSSTTYTVVGTDANGCSSSDTVSITVQSLPSASAGTAAAICNGTSTMLNGSGGGTYSWSPAISLSSPTIANPVASPTATTNYTVTVTNAGGCTATSTVTVTVNPVPTATVSANVTICNGASTTLTAGGGGTYLWSPAGSLSNPAISNPVATPSSTTTYTVAVSNGMCTSTTSVTVTVNSTLSMATATTVTATCGNADGSITAGAVTGGSSPFTYSLNGGAAQSSAAFSGLTSGSYLLMVTDAAGCSFSQTVNVGSILGVNAAFTANPSSGSSPLTVDLTNGSNGATGYIWDFGDGSSSVLTNPSVIYTVNGTYVITLVAYNGSFACSDTTTITINVFDQAMMVVPNVFTPNGDTRNDVFVVQSTGIKELNGTIYNRWGKKIAEWSGSPTLGWDGKINGNAAEDGTYYYVIKATGFDEKEYDAAGFLQLINN